MLLIEYIAGKIWKEKIFLKLNKLEYTPESKEKQELFIRFMLWQKLYTLSKWSKFIHAYSFLVLINKRS
jgi:hypothetical protein